RRDPAIHADDRGALRSRHRPVSRLRGGQTILLARLPVAGRLVRGPASLLIVRLLVAGATGFVGSLLAGELSAGGHAVRCLVRNPSRVGDLEKAGCEVVAGDALDAVSLRGAGKGIDAAYYLIHSMGRGGGA